MESLTRQARQRTLWLKWKNTYSDILELNNGYYGGNHLFLGFGFLIC